MLKIKKIEKYKNVSRVIRQILMKQLFVSHEAVKFINEMIGLKLLDTVKKEYFDLIAKWE